MTVPFEQLHRELDGYPSALKCLAEALEPQHPDWRLIGLDARDLAERELCLDPILDYEPKRHQPAHRSTAATSQTSRAVALSTDDPLKNIAPAVYVEALTGEQVPANGWMRCVLPDHEDATPSFQVLASHWRCFGCGRGGSVIDLAAALYGLEPRGPGYIEIRRRLAAEFGLARSQP